MDSHRRFTLTDFCVICGVFGILSCQLIPRLGEPPPLSDDQATTYRHGPSYTSTAVSVREPNGRNPGRINLAAFNNSGEAQSNLVSQYQSSRPIVVENIDSSDKNVSVTTTNTTLEARFGRVPAGRQVAVAIKFHFDSQRTNRLDRRSVEF